MPDFQNEQFECNQLQFNKNIQQFLIYSNTCIQKRVIFYFQITDYLAQLRQIPKQSMQLVSNQNRQVKQQISNGFNNAKKCQSEFQCSSEMYCDIQSANQKDNCTYQIIQTQSIDQFKNAFVRNEILVTSLKCFNIFVKNYDNVLVAANFRTNQLNQQRNPLSLDSPANQKLVNPQHMNNLSNNIRQYIKKIIEILKQELSHSHTETQYKLYLAFEYCKFLLTVLPIRISQVVIVVMVDQSNKNNNNNKKQQLYYCQLFDQFSSAVMTALSLMRKFYTSDAKSNRIYRSQFLQILMESVRAFHKIIPYHKINIIKSIINYLNRNSNRPAQIYQKPERTAKQKRALLILQRIKQNWSSIKQRSMFQSYCQMIISKPEKATSSLCKSKIDKIHVENDHILRLRPESSKGYLSQQQQKVPQTISKAIKVLKRNRSQSMKIQRSKSIITPPNNNSNKNMDLSFKTEITTQLQKQISKVADRRVRVNRSYSTTTNNFHNNAKNSNQNVNQFLTLSNCVQVGKQNDKINQNKTHSKQIQLKFEDYRWKQRQVYKQKQKQKSRCHQLKLQPLKIVLNKRN